MTPPLAEDKRIQSLNYVDASIANRYQLGDNTSKAKGGESDGED